MSGNDWQFYMVRKDMLPEAMYKTVLAKEMLSRGEAASVEEAVQKLGFSRSTYYKYKDVVFSFFSAQELKILNLLLLLDHKSGILSGVLNCIAKFKANILTINQNLPFRGVAYVTISVAVDNISEPVDKLLSELRETAGVLSVKIIGRS
ncbi:MAG: ACT domain-containing protein [Syntrophomonadaceae bacterium]